MTPPHDMAKWLALEGRAHEPQVQARIRRGIREGKIRVVPGADGGIRILPVAPVLNPPDPHRPRGEGTRP